MLRVQSVATSVAQNGRTEQGVELLYFDQLGGFQVQIMSFSCMHKDAGESRFTVTLHFQKGPT